MADLELVKQTGLEGPPLKMEVAAAATAVEAVTPNANARAWGVASGLLSSLAVAIMAAPIPWPWGLVAGSVLGTASAVCAMVAARRFDAQAVGQLVATVASAVAEHRAKNQPAAEKPPPT